MSTQYYSTIPKTFNEATAIAKFVGWKMVKIDGDRLLTDGHDYVRDLMMVRNGKKPFCFTFTRYNTNDCESLVDAFEAWSEHDNTMLNCDDCGDYIWELEMLITANEECVCQKCHDKVR